jgi:hypothetical protein
MLSSGRTLISTPITLLANTTYNYASRFHLIPSAGADLEANLSQPGSARAEAERRRFVVFLFVWERRQYFHFPERWH